ncbi:hypothetical protein NUM3379_15440 [Kineococcus sp. NUM-3379]
MTGFAPSAVRAAATADRLLAQGTEMPEVFRHVVLQLLDDYTTVRGTRGTAAAAGVFRDEPPHSADRRVDAALAALAEHLARQDGWVVPAWAADENRYAVPWWFVTPLTALHPYVLVSSPLSFRKRGVFIDPDSLTRV